MRRLVLAALLLVGFAGTALAQDAASRGVYNPGGVLAPPGAPFPLQLDAAGNLMVNSVNGGGGGGTVNQGTPNTSTNAWPVYTAQPAVSPSASSGATTITAGGTAQSLFSAGSVTHGCYIVNPQSSTEQGIPAAEILYVDFTGASASSGSGTSLPVYPGVSFPCPTALATSVSVVAATTNHAFKAIKW